MPTPCAANWRIKAVDVVSITGDTLTAERAKAPSRMGRSDIGAAGRISGKPRQSASVAVARPASAWPGGTTAPSGHSLANSVRRPAVSGTS